MKSVQADLNRRGPDGTFLVSLNRFSETPEVGEDFLLVDGEDTLTGEVYYVGEYSVCFTTT